MLPLTETGQELRAVMLHPMAQLYETEFVGCTDDALMAGGAPVAGGGWWVTWTMPRRCRSPRRV